MTRVMEEGTLKADRTGTGTKKCIWPPNAFRFVGRDSLV